MADCYIVRRGGAGGGEKDSTDIMLSIGYVGLIPPIEDVLISDETEE
ncbi:MAG: hypothetical protein ACI4F7_12220 [Acutalibacteraceae bacterium]